MAENGKVDLLQLIIAALLLIATVWIAYQVVRG